MEKTPIHEQIKTEINRIKKLLLPSTNFLEVQVETIQAEEEINDEKFASILTDINLPLKIIILEEVD